MLRQAQHDTCVTLSLSKGRDNRCFSTRLEVRPTRVSNDSYVRDSNDPKSNIPANPYTSRWTAERPSEGDYEPKDEHKGGNALKTAGGAAAGLALLAAKFKGLLVLLLNIKWLFFFWKFFTFGGTFLLSLWVYALLFGWKFGVVFILLIAGHEFGHYVAFRNYGLKVALPHFIPLLGAFTAGETPANAEQSAYISLAGPLTGLGLAAGCYAIGTFNHEPFWIAAAYLGAFLNLFNMVPTPPFDGGAIAAVLSPRVWVIGFVVFIGVALYLHLAVIFVIILALFGLPRVIAGFKGNYDPAYYATPPLARLNVGLWYLAIAFGLVYFINIAHINVAR